MNILEITSSCSDPALGTVLYVVKNALNIIQLLGPIVSICAMIYHLIMLLKNPEDKKAISKIRNSIIALVVLFMVPVMVNAIMGVLDDSTVLSDCWNNVTVTPGGSGGYIDPNSGDKRHSVYEDPSDYENGKPSTSSNGNNATNTNSNGNNNTNNSNNKNGNSSNNSGTGNKTSSGNSSSSKTIFIGDSRTVQMYAYLNNNWSGANYSSGGVHEVGSDVYVAEGSMGLNWLKSTGIPAAEKYFNNGTAIVILMGVNDLYNADNYVKYINENSSTWKSKGSSLYFVSVNPCTGNYNYLNSKINTFNSTVKNGLSKDVGWIDTSSQLNGNNITSNDGLHYGKSTYQIIYNYIKNSV